MTDTSTDALLPCPFCGGEGRYQKDHTTEYRDSIWCRNCDFGMFDPDDEGSVVAAWNRRTLVPALLKERDELRARVRALEEITDPDFIWGALDNVHDMDVTLDDYAKAVSRAQRAALAASQPADPVTNAGSCQPTLADALRVLEVQAVVATLQYALELCEDGHPVSAKNLAHACLRAIGEGEA